MAQQNMAEPCLDEMECNPSRSNLNYEIAEGHSADCDLGND